VCGGGAWCRSAGARAATREKKNQTPYLFILSSENRGVQPLLGELQVGGSNGRAPQSNVGHRAFVIAGSTSKVNVGVLLQRRIVASEPILELALVFMRCP